MSKLQDNRTTPQFMAMLEKWAFFLTLNLHFQQIRFLSLKMQLEIRHFSVLRLLLFLYFGHLFCLLRNMRSRVEISLLISFVTQCLKITENVSFSIASETSYVCILSGQQLIKKKAINSQFCAVK